ncbi:MAG: hypothetical protein M3282_02600 [Gemmatimonadota bacterium]|nr:hypothetical protein [Gemmatimonadota bacterium]
MPFPLDWLLANAAPPLQYRAVTDVARLSDRVGPDFANLPLTYRPALMLAATQAADGTWNRAMLTLPSPRAEHFEGVGTINAARRLLEYGWTRETPTLLHARRPLFRLLAEDEHISQLYEFAGRGPADEDLVRRGRAILREAAAAALAQAGYEDDPRLRGAARRVLGRISDYVRSPLAEKPFVRVGNQHVLAPDAAPPSIYALAMLAHMPLFRTEYHDEMDRVYDAVAQPLPRQEAAQLCGKHIIEQPHLVLGDMLPTRNVVDADVPWALMWLELMARLGFLRRNEGWSRLYDRLLDGTDARGVWRPAKGTTPAKGIALRAQNPFTWHMYPLDAGRTVDGGSTDVTFRLGVIARLSGRAVELQ